MSPDDRISTHPGETLLHDFLVPLNLSTVQLADHLGWSVVDVDAIAMGQAPVTAELAWLLSMAFGTSPQFWLNLQATHDLTRSRPVRKIPLIVR